MTSNIHIKDPTFRNYNSEDAAKFAKSRLSYSSALYDAIIKYHTTSGQFDTLLDVGCGSGAATRDLGHYFSHAKGIDPGQELILQARKLGGQTKSGEAISYDVHGAEDLASGFEPGSIDMLSAGMAAHWFDMRAFWVNAAKVVKTGGTVALFTQSSLYCHPSTAAAEEVQRILTHLEDDILGEHELESNKLSRNMYDKLTLPWQVDVPEFPQETFQRHEWNRDGKLDVGETYFFGGSEYDTLEKLAQSLGTASMVTRWRTANAHSAGTDADCVTLTMANIAKAMGNDSEDFGKTKIRTGSSTTLLLFTRVK
ncbi:S-adenosyl-L-methionine-dependent methyltransferase [Microthyrium microscopicum]|uniref:S-adenosyl-L-methionine-dependent methyltransferase n=1 Tax=Microthyrium microscopicum TaxID=703497 RepID=A0A6A6UIT1_9PEZI|nr:S-adenosyl-L-methionine-dependent methyltransferase [Microthyrium microscopicum]